MLASLLGHLVLHQEQQAQGLRPQLMEPSGGQFISSPEHQCGMGSDPTGLWDTGI